MTGAHHSLLLQNAGIPGGGRRDVRIEDGVVADVADAGTLPVTGEVLELTGFLLLPAPAEPHAHYDTALTAATVPNPGGTLGGAVDAWRAVSPSVEPADFEQRATEVALRALANGATAIRSHVGIYPEVGLRAVEALLRVRERLRPWIDVQLAALTVELTTPQGKQMEPLLREALRLGVDVVGGCPHLDPDPATCMDIYLDLAAEGNRQADLHTDEQLDPALDNLPLLAAKVRERGLEGRVTASHCVSLGMQSASHARDVASALAAARVAVVSNPQTNLFLQAREVESAKPRGLTAVRPLLDAGVVVAGGGDNVQDPFNPMGRADPLETASLLVTAGHLEPAEAYAAVSSGARTAMGLPEVGTRAGSPAEFLAVRGGSIGEVLADPSDRLVIHRGRLVSRTTVSRQVPLPA